MTYSLSEFLKQKMKEAADARAIQACPLFCGPVCLPSAEALFDGIADSPSIVICDSSALSRHIAPVSIELLRRFAVGLSSETARETARFMAMSGRTAEEIKLIDELKRAQAEGRMGCLVPRGSESQRRAFYFYVKLLGMRKWVPHSQKNNDAFQAALKSVGDSTRLVAKTYDPDALEADEESVVLAFYLAAMNSKTAVYLLTRDKGVVLQAYKLASLVRDDHMSFLAANDFLRNPTRYGDRVLFASDTNAELLCDPARSFAVRRAGVDVYAMIPWPETSFNYVVVDISRDRPEAIAFNMSGGLSTFFIHKGALRGRNSDAVDGLNCYVNVPHVFPSLGLDPQAVPHMLLLADRFLPSPTDEPGFSFTMVDYLRSLLDFERPMTYSVFA